MERRDFLRQLSAIGVGASPLLACVDRLVREVGNQPDAALAGDERFWAEIRATYRLTPDYVNLEGGYYCMMSEPLVDRVVAHLREVNLRASHYMRSSLESDKRRVVARLAGLAGCDGDELVITRNATESLDLVIGGYPWRAGDEAVVAEQDYGSMLDMFDLQARRHGIVVRRVSIPNHPASDQELVDLYAAAIGERTRLLMVCHMVNITGQILPVAKICAMARARGVETMVDGAHAFAHIDSNIPALGADYYGASLHKWLGAPLGSGILWVKRERIPALWPLLAEGPRDPGDISRLNHTGTTPPHVLLGIADAIELHERLGPARKQARLGYLRAYWTDRVRGIPRVVLNTPEDPARACAIANVGIDGVAPDELARRLLEEHGIWTVAIDRPGVRGCRVTPGLYTAISELDRLVEALAAIARA